MKAIIVEDSQLARQKLTALLKKHPDIEIIGEAGHPDEAEPLIKNLAPDLIFLDIHMPGRSGLELLDSLPNPPAVIFTTAYTEYAIDSFEYNTVDYLVKPIHPKKLARALLKCTKKDETDIYENSELKVISECAMAIDSQIFVRDGQKCHLIRLADIACMEVNGNYTNVVFEGNTCLIPRTLNYLESRLPQRYFFRANRQFIVNLKFVSEVQPWVNGGFQLTLGSGHQVEVSRRNASRFSELYSF